MVGYRCLQSAKEIGCTTTVAVNFFVNNLEIIFNRIGKPSAPAQEDERWGEVETNYASFDFHFWVLFFRFSPFSTYCTFVNTVLTHIKIGTSVEWNCSNNLSKY